MDAGTLVKFNPWWEHRPDPLLPQDQHERPVMTRIWDYCPKRFILLLFGLRRSGKTVLMRQVVQRLLKTTDPLHIFYFSFDEKAEDLDLLLRLYEEKILRRPVRDVSRFYLFFDEVQKLPDWETKIKLLYDLNPHCKIFLSGSASARLQKGSRESLAGRIIEIEVKPLDFGEFLAWKKAAIDQSHPEIYQETAQFYLLDYARKGGFPEITNEENDEVIRSYIKTAVLERLLFRDLPEAFGIKDFALLQTLTELFAGQPGMIVNLDRLARDLGRHKITVANYISHLEYALIIREIKNFRRGELPASRKGKKYYPASSAFSFAYREDFYEDSFLEKVAEVLTAEKINASFYYRNGFEVDFVRREKGKIIPVEVKYGRPDQTQVRRFRQKFAASSGTVVSKDVFLPAKDGVNVIPLWLFLASETPGSLRIDKR